MFSYNEMYWSERIVGAGRRVVYEGGQEEVLATIYDNGYISVNIDDMDHKQFAELSEFIIRLCLIK